MGVPINNECPPLAIPTYGFQTETTFVHVINYSVNISVHFNMI